MADIKIKINAIAISLLVVILITFLFVTLYNITSWSNSLNFCSICTWSFMIFICIFVLTVNSSSFILVNMLPNSSHWLGLLHSILSRNNSSQRAHILISIFIIGATFQLLCQLICCSWRLGSASAALLALLACHILVAQCWFLLSTRSRQSLFWFSSTVRSFRCGWRGWVCVLLIESGDERRSRGSLFGGDLLRRWGTCLIGWTAIAGSLKHI